MALPTYLLSNFNATQDGVVWKMGWEILLWNYNSFTWVDLIHEHGSAYWLSILCVFVHGIIDVLNQLIANLDVFAADAWYRFLIHVRLLVRFGIVIVMIAEPWHEGAHDGPAGEHLRFHDLVL